MRCPPQARAPPRIVAPNRRGIYYKRLLRRLTGGVALRFHFYLPPSQAPAWKGQLNRQALLSQYSKSNLTP